MKKLTQAQKDEANALADELLTSLRSEAYDGLANCDTVYANETTQKARQQAADRFLAEVAKALTIKMKNGL